MKIAIITHALPPSNHANGKRPFYIARDLLEAGHEVVIYTSHLGGEQGAEEILKHPKCRIERVEDPVMNAIAKVSKSKFLYRFAVKAVNGLIWPDFYRLWVKKMLKLYKKEDSFDKVLAFIFPASVYLAAKKGLVDERWVFDLQESVTPQQSILPRRSYLFKKRLPQLEALEKEAMSKAGNVVFTAQTNRDAYVDRALVKVEKTEHIPYFYDESYFSSTSDKVDEGFEFRYFGGFDWRGSRSPELFFNALKAFLELRPEARSETRFAFYGNWMSEHDALVDQAGLGDVVKINSAVSFSEYLEKVATAPALLLVIANEHRLFMPSKIVDYLGARRPLLALVPEGSEMQNVLQEAEMGHQVVTSNQVESVVKVIDELWGSYLAGKLYVESQTAEKWSSSYQLGRYRDVLMGGKS